MKTYALSSLVSLTLCSMFFAACDEQPRQSGCYDRTNEDRGAQQECLTDFHTCIEQAGGADFGAISECQQQLLECIDAPELPGDDDLPSDDDPPGGGGGGGGSQQCSLAVSNSTNGSSFAVECTKEVDAAVIECSCEVDGVEQAPLSVPTANAECGFDRDEITAVSDACVAQAS